MRGINLCQNDTKNLKESLSDFNKTLYIPIIIKKRLKCSIVFFFLISRRHLCTFQTRFLNDRGKTTERSQNLMFFLNTVSAVVHWCSKYMEYICNRMIII